MIEEKALSKDGNSIWKITTDPSIEPITVDELKLFARIDGNDEDTLLESFITAARLNCEGYLGRALIEQTITLMMDFWPGEVIKLPRPPLISITAVETLDEDNNATEYSSDNYYTVTEAIPGELIIKRGVTQPYNNARDYRGYQIRYKAGYGNSRSDIPSGIKEGLKLWATDVYENRVVRPEPPPEARQVLQLFRVIPI